jgi:hypothetical protein
MQMSALTIISPLAFPLPLESGQVIETVGDAANYLRRLPDEDRGRYHWKVAIRMLDHALTEPLYLKTATISLQTALAMDRKLTEPPSD